MPELFSPGHLIVLAIIALVLFFGWKQLPDMARSMGRSMRVFKTEIKGMTEDDKAREAARQADGQAKAIEATPAVAPVVTPVVPAQAAVEAPRVAARPRPAPSPNGRVHEVPAEGRGSH